MNLTSPDGQITAVIDDAGEVGQGAPQEKFMSNQSNPDEFPVSHETETTSPRYLSAPKICHNPNCSFQTHEPLHHCPKCGRPIWTTNQFRAISAVLIFCGLFFIVFGGGLIYALAPIDNNSSRTRFTGSEARKIFILGIIGVILAFGLSVLAAGLWQVIFGRANRRLIYILLSFLLVLLTIVGVGRLILELSAS